MLEWVVDRSGSWTRAGVGCGWEWVMDESRSGLWMGVGCGQEWVMDEGRSGLWTGLNFLCSAKKQDVFFGQQAGPISTAT